MVFDENRSDTQLYNYISVTTCSSLFFFVPKHIFVILTVEHHILFTIITILNFITEVTEIFNHNCHYQNGSVMYSPLTTPSLKSTKFSTPYTFADIERL